MVMSFYNTYIIVVGWVCTG